MPLDRVVLIVLDSCGCGAAPDAADYGDEGANTLGNMARALGGLALPELGRLGLGRLTEIAGVPPAARPSGAYGTMREASHGKDTTTGHWELAGLLVEQGFATFPRGFPRQMIEEFEQLTGRSTLGNKAASGTAIIEELGAQHLASGSLIVYTSADSVFQIAAHEQLVPLDELYRDCEIARQLCDRHHIARVIARPFVGQPGSFSRTYNRRDFSTPPPAPTVLDRLVERGWPVIGIGKIWDIYAGAGVSRQVHTEGNGDSLEQTRRLLGELERGLLFVNLVDFDMLYGHRRNPQGYYAALQQFDRFVPQLRALLGPRDMAILVADHGNDPTFHGTDHTREDVPLLAFGRRERGVDLGLRRGFYDVAQTLCAAFGLDPWPRGQSFLDEVMT